ncbi:nucleoside-triphosphatase [Lentzea californiensis]|uniref:nucleoside-triphosphatase n=1 Tax=Lentzea californiensis TaxID=438851 RepID=UPI0021667044|nr:nucleoside-triphosphatase [Lentzea californiensis]MCR3752679.1 nucleoside-triphosphatase [Lentzea californiensis]
MEGIGNLVLLSGPPGVGKSTAIRRIAEHFDDERITAILSSEIRREGRRQGFQMEVLHTGRLGLLASPEVDSDVRFGSLRPDGRPRLGVTFDFLEGVACPAIVGGAAQQKTLVIDEIGPMQASSSYFRDVIENLLVSGNTLVASIAQSDDPWITRIREDQHAALIVLDERNRNLVAAALGVYLSTRTSADVARRA